MSTIHGKSHKAIRLFRNPPAALPVYWIFCARRNKEGVAWASIRGLITDTGWSQNPVKDGRNWLVEHEALQRVLYYVRPSWRKLPEEERKRRMARDRVEYYRVTGYIVIDGVTYQMLYAPADDAEEEDEGAVSSHDTAPAETGSSVSCGDVSPGDTALAVSRHDMSPDDTELDSFKELTPSLSSELDPTTTSGEGRSDVVVVDENDQTHWEACFHQLQMQLDSQSFETWLRGAVLLAVERPNVAEAATYVIGVRNSYAQASLQGRLYRKVHRVLSDIAPAPVELRFEIFQPEPAAVTDEALPLFKRLAALNPADPLAGTYQPTPDKTIRDLFETYIEPITDSNRRVVELLEQRYSVADVGYAMSEMAGKQTQGLVNHPLSYTLGILRRMVNA